MITFKEFLNERTVSSKKAELIEDSSIINAVLKEDISKTEELLQQGVNPDSKPPVRGDKDYALIEAIYLRSEELSELLLKHGANPNIRSVSDKATPLLIAVIRGNYDKGDSLVEMLLKYGADVNTPCTDDNDTLLKEIVWYDKAPKMFEYLVSKVDINATNSAGRTALHDAVIRDREAMLVELIKHGGDMNKESNNGSTPMDLLELKTDLRDKLKQRGII